MKRRMLGIMIALVVACSGALLVGRTHQLTYTSTSACTKAEPGYVVLRRGGYFKPVTAIGSSHHFYAFDQAGSGLGFSACSFGTYADNGATCIGPSMDMSNTTNQSQALGYNHGALPDGGSFGYTMTGFVDNAVDQSLQDTVLCPSSDPCPQGQTCSGNSPIIVPTRPGNEVKLSSAAGGVHFDIHNDGTSPLVAWPRYPNEDAFLGIDKNGNGIIDNAGELIGNKTVAGSGDGLAALRALMGYPAAYLTPSDPLFSKLVLWFDRNRDGICTPDEIEPASNYIAKIALGGFYEGKKDQYGNEYRSKGAMTFVGHPDDWKPVYDIWLVANDGSIPVEPGTHTQ